MSIALNQSVRLRAFRKFSSAQDISDRMASRSHCIVTTNCLPRCVMAGTNDSCPPAESVQQQAEKGPPEARGRSERTMPATTNNTAAGARTRSRGNASGCRQTASHVEMNTRRPLPWRLLRGQAKAGRVRCCRPPLGLCARKKRRG